MKDNQWKMIEVPDLFSSIQVIRSSISSETSCKIRHKSSGLIVVSRNGMFNNNSLQTSRYSMRSILIGFHLAHSSNRQNSSLDMTVRSLKTLDIRTEDQNRNGCKNRREKTELQLRDLG